MQTEIRKLFKFDATHIVRNCSSDRCKKSIHSHSYTIECFFTADNLDNGQMIYDFGLMKNTIKQFINMFNSWHYWDKENKSYIDFIKENTNKYIELSFSLSAEQYSKLFLININKILDSTIFSNGESEVKCTSVRVHETNTGYAETFKDNVIFDTCGFNVSKKLYKKNKNLLETIMSPTEMFHNPKVDIQIK